MVALQWTGDREDRWCYLLQCWWTSLIYCFFQLRGNLRTSRVSGDLFATCVCACTSRVCVWMWIICVYRYMHVYLNVCGYVCTGILPLLLFITCTIVIKRKTISTCFVIFKSPCFSPLITFSFFTLHSAGDKMSPPLTWNGWRQA